MRTMYFKKIIFLFLLLPCLLPGIRAEKNYSFPRLTLEAQLHPDGSMTVMEIRTFKFEESYRFAFRTFPKSERVVFTDFHVTERGIPYALSNTQEPGTCEILESAGQTLVRWYFKARDESRTFTIQYRVLGAVGRYDDASVLYYQFVSSEWDRSTNEVSVTVTPPDAYREGVSAWLHGPLWAEMRIAGDGTLYAWCDRLPLHTFLEIRAMYPTALFPAARSQSGSVRTGILQEEASLAEAANLERAQAIRKEEGKLKRWNMGKWIVAVLSGAGLFIWWNLYRSYHKKPRIPHIPRMDSAIPAKTPPALVDYLIHHRSIYGTSLVGTLLDLARRGFLSLKEERKEARGLLGGTRTGAQISWELKRSYMESHRASLEPFEEDLIHFLFNDLAGGADVISLKTIEKKRNAFIRFFRTWEKDVKKLGKEQGWFDQKSIKGMTLSLILGVVCILLAIPLAFLFGPWAIIAAFSGFVILLLSLALPARTDEGERLFYQWTALKKYLQKIHPQDAVQLLSSIDQYLVYGLVLGLSKNKIKNMAMIIPPDQAVHYVPWYIYGGSGGSFSAEGFGTSLSSAISVSASALSSASGTGGGASGGWGGAGGGGGRGRMKCFCEFQSPSGKTLIFKNQGHNYRLHIQQEV